MNFINRLFLIGIFAFGVLFPQFASAQSSESCSRPNPEVVAMKKLPDSVSKITNLGSGSMLQTFSGAGQNIGSRLVPAAKGLAGVLLLISFLAAGVKALISGSPLRNELIDAVVNGAIIAAVLSQYGTFARMGVSLAETLNGVVGGNLSTALVTFIANFFNVLTSAWESFTVGWACMSIWEWKLAMFLDMFFGAIILAGALIITVFAFAEMLYVTLLGPVLVGIALAFGPIAIATLASKATRSFFDKWLSFIASALVVQFVTFVILELMGTVMLNATNQLTPGNSFMVHAITIALIAMMLGKIFAQVPQIASGLTGGKLGASGDSNAASTFSAGAVAGGGAGVGVGAIAAYASKGASTAAAAKGGASKALQIGRN